MLFLSNRLYRLVAIIVLPLLVLMSAASGAGAEEESMVRVAVLQGLDKTTARVSKVEVPIGGIARFGSLEIVSRACEEKPPTEPPESAAFLEITDMRPDSPAIEIFSGWMFASSPAVSALEHPVYDVWVVDCSDVPLSATPAAGEQNAETGGASTQ